MPAHDDLRSLITPGLLNFIVDAKIPHSRTEPLDFAEVTRSMSGSDFSEKLQSTTARDALIVISQMAPNGKMPSATDLDLMSFLPPPESPEFPKQCLGLQLLLDQASRVLFGGVDGRWQSALFGPLARRLVGQWLALPAEQRPETWTRWRDDAGVSSFDYWLVSRLVWIAPISHDEDLESQRIALELTEETRSMVEDRFGVKDPYRATREELLKDTLAFLREMPKGVPPKATDGSTDRATWMFWWCMILDAHWPIIERFGRYPYRNAILGRQSTEEEKQWLDATSHVAEAPPDVAEAIKRDIARGIWTPFGQGGQ
ncbi:hypothetical protein LEL_07785 [Akanthomyces lecanii RCEF 1005]|uniref:Uncharacterized protein n=1 Tax=Akanthomyces lecanii RCEF 1005 TaxID=1081108 RepID=A0A168FYY6_CORDF|nr:hypothetical protein LEL_07785 [Akanthomyces lecanii RCEF 1005]